ncbi:MAG: hypothetical protein K5787_17575 [Lentisphaeria bacterium]|nr:hypothetical protein [Lentisphaeria bacterium]
MNAKFVNSSQSVPQERDPPPQAGRKRDLPTRRRDARGTSHPQAGTHAGLRSPQAERTRDFPHACGISGKKTKQMVAKCLSYTILIKVFMWRKSLPPSFQQEIYQKKQ